MIAYISGQITHKNPAYLYVETNGVGYHINISLHTYAKVEKLEKVKLLTHLQVKEDSHTLFGFFDHDERSLFVHLISVSGIGANTARVILSYMAPNDVRQAIMSENVTALSSVKGIGPKTAKRIILDLKDKVVKNMGDVATIPTPVDNTIRQDALDGLTALGYPKAAVEKQLSKVLSSATDIDNPGDLIKLVLKQMR